MQTTRLQLSDVLPLNCSRKGTCCHGNLVRVNPFEVQQLAKAKNMAASDFMKDYLADGGTRLKFDGSGRWENKSSCNLYDASVGCTVHPARPLACRLFPLGRQIQFDKANYVFEGIQFPCIGSGCPEVQNLPEMTVQEYLEGQETSVFELAQDEYLEVVQNLADLALMLLLDTELASSGDTNTLRIWKQLGQGDSEKRSDLIAEWLDELVIPANLGSITNPGDFAAKHNERLTELAQERINQLSTLEEVSQLSVRFMAMALHLAHAIGANHKALADHWIAIARENGAK